MNAERGEMITFQFKDPVNGFIELDMNIPQERSFKGWTLVPYKRPLRVMSIICGWVLIIAILSR